MELKILFFASLREAAGGAERFVDVDPGTTVSGLWSSISRDFDPLPSRVLCAVNQEYVDFDHKLGQSDREVAFFPPVTGG